MRHRALLLGVLLPAALSHAFYGALFGRRDHRHVRVEREIRAEMRMARPPRPPLPPRRPRALGSFCPMRLVLPLSAPASADGQIAVVMGAGDLQMEGVEGLDQVQVEATLCALSSEQLERLGVTLVPDGDVLRLDAVEPTADRGGWVDLTVRVPLGMKATIDETRAKAPRGYARPLRGRP